MEICLAKNGIYKIKTSANDIIPMVIVGDKVLGLEGATIEIAAVEIYQLNNNGELVFLGTLSDGRSGLFI